MEKRNPALTVDGVIIIEEKIILIKRGNPPFKGSFALPGGFVDYGETLEQAVLREIEEETGLKTEIVKLLGIYSDPERDPRGHTVSAVFLLEKTGGKMISGDDAADVGLFDLNDLPDLAFDHEKIINDYWSCVVVSV